MVRGARGTSVSERASVKRVPAGETSVSKRAPANRVPRGCVQRGRRRDKSVRATAVRQGEKHGNTYHQRTEIRPRVVKSKLKGHLLLRAPSMLSRLDAARRRTEKVKKNIYISIKSDDPPSLVKTRNPCGQH